MLTLLQSHASFLAPKRILFMSHFFGGNSILFGILLVLLLVFPLLSLSEKGENRTLERIFAGTCSCILFLPDINFLFSHFF